MGKLTRNIIKISLLCIACVLLCSCSQGPSRADITQSDITQYLECFKAKDYKTMFSLTAPSVEITEEGFIKKYDDIFSGLGVTEIAIDNISGPDETGTFTYSATYKTKDYGDFTSGYTLRTTIKDNECFVVWDYSLIFPEMEEGSSVRVKTLKAVRGEIFGSDGTLIAENSYADTVYLDIAKVQDITAVANAACPVTGVTQTELIQKFNAAVQNGTEAVPLGEYFAGQLTEQQRQSILSVPGLGIDNEMYTPIRNYPLREAAAHIAGYTAPVDPDNVPEGYESSDRIGKTGLEGSFEDELRGRDGKIIYIEDKWGNKVRTLYEKKDAQGQDLWLTIDPAMQQRAYNSLTTHLTQGQTGVAIVMDAKTGYVEAMASFPSYDDNIFTFPIPDDVWQSLNSDDSGHPLYSWATQGLYPPGSVIKPFTATAALENGAITPDTVFDGQITDNQWMPTEEGWHWDAITRVDDSGTPLKLYNALIHSDNIYFAFAAMRLGDENFLGYLNSIGLEEAVPFDLPVKEANIKNNDRSMDRRLLADMGYGQGDLLVTPIQLAAMYTAFANGTGDMIKPVLVQKTCRTEGLDYVTVNERQPEDPEVWKQGAVPQSSLETLLPMMKDVIKSAHGTGYRANIPGIGLAGKTGTAEIGSDKSREISWFAGFWTDGYYDRLVVVMVDTAAEEGIVKFDIAKDLLTP